MNKLGYKAVAVATALAMPAGAFAAELGGEEAPKAVYAKFADILGSIIQYYLMFGSLLWVIFILVHGFSMLGKSDNRGKEEAKEKLMTTLKTGVLVLVLPALGAFLIWIVGSQIMNDDTGVFNGTMLSDNIKSLSQ